MAPSPRAVPAVVTVAGTYDGTIVEVEKGQTHTADVTITIAQSGKSISGSFVIEFAQGNIDLALYGTIKKDTAKSAKIVFGLDDSSGRYGTAKATVTDKGLHGRAKVPPHGSMPAITATFKAKRQ